MSILEGRVKKLMDRGYGFIEDLGGESYFFHRTEVKGVAFEELNREDLVEFEPGENEKGKHATNVKRIQEETEQETEEEKETGEEKEPE